MATGVNELDIEAVASGGWRQARGFEVTKKQIADYAAATNDPIVPHRAGDYAPPLFAVVPSLETLMGLIAEAVPEHLRKNMVHTRHQFQFYGPILPGARISTRGKVLGYRPVQKGTEVNFCLESHDEHDALVVDQVVTLHIRRYKIARAVGAPPIEIAQPGAGATPVKTVLAEVDDDQPSRYAEASGDDTPIHLNASAAKDAGLQGVILHGLCTMAFATWAVLDTLTESRRRPVVKRFSAELVSPVFPSCQLATTIWRNRAVDDPSRISFRSCVDGSEVLRGVASIAGHFSSGSTQRRGVTCK